VTVQARRCLDIIFPALEEAGTSPGDVIRTRIYLRDSGDADPVSGVHGETFGEIRPATTMVVVAALVDPRWRLEIEAEAIVGSA
jgi:enamine deaminase RidA (YjgF/YER057c/UK114 family)